MLIVAIIGHLWNPTPMPPQHCTRSTITPSSCPMSALRYWPAFRERVEASGSLPKFVVRDFDEYLRCGILEYGFIRAECHSCGFDRLVALSCKRRGFCPSCLGRRMSDTAVWLTEHVIPRVQIRQWVLTLP